ncbi:MAG: hypothetical protein PF484_01245, partial [Bacteroidales bacterium]|nr:hypothetical protein [Bacteroidales bacterium]
MSRKIVFHDNHFLDFYAPLKDKVKIKAMTDYKGIKTFDELIEREHGEIGTDSRNEYEENATL